MPRSSAARSRSLKKFVPPMLYASTFRSTPLTVSLCGEQHHGGKTAERRVVAQALDVDEPQRLARLRLHALHTLAQDARPLGAQDVLFRVVESGQGCILRQKLQRVAAEKTQRQIARRAIKNRLKSFSISGDFLRCFRGAYLVLSTWPMLMMSGFLIWALFSSYSVFHSLPLPNSFCEMLHRQSPLTTV